MVYSKEDQLAAQRKHYANNKQYYADRNIARREKLRAYIRAAKNVPCMDFDHREGKEFDIALAVNRMMSLERVQMEIDKCDVVCANCHRIRTHQ